MNIQMPKRHMLNSAGFALPYVIVLILLLSLLTAALAIASTNANRASMRATEFEQMYFTAESIVQIGDAVLTSMMARIINDSDREIPLSVIIPEDFPAGLNDPRELLVEAVEEYLEAVREEVAETMGDFRDSLLTDGEIIVAARLDVDKDTIEVQGGIAFFAEPEVDDSPGFFSGLFGASTPAEPAINPFAFTLTATYIRAGNQRSVSLARPYTTSGATVLTGGGDANGIWVSEQGIFAASQTWGGFIETPDGLRVFRGEYPHAPYEEFGGPHAALINPRTDLNDVMSDANRMPFNNRTDLRTDNARRGHINIETVTNNINQTVITKIADEVNALLPTGQSVTRNALTANNPLVLPAGWNPPANPIHPIFIATAQNTNAGVMANVHNEIEVIWRTDGDLHLRGNFPNVRIIYVTGNVSLQGSFPRLEAIYAGQTLQLGQRDGIAHYRFVANRSSATNPLYMFSRQNIVIDTSLGFTALNVRMATNGAVNMWTTDVLAADRSVQTNAQVYASGQIIIAHADFDATNPNFQPHLALNARNWAKNYVPAFYSTSAITLNVAQANEGWSGIFYTPDNNIVAVIRTSAMNGAFLTGNNFGGATIGAMRIDSTTVQRADVYLNLLGRSWTNLHPRLRQYFGLFADHYDSELGGWLGGRQAIVIPPERPLRHAPAIVREVANHLPRTP